MDEYKHFNILSMAQRVQVIKEYNSSNPKPSYEVLAKKYNATAAHIRTTVRNQVYFLRQYKLAGDAVQKDVPTKIPKLLSLPERIQIIKEYNSSCPKTSYELLAKKYNASFEHVRSTISNQEHYLGEYAKPKDNIEKDPTNDKNHVDIEEISNTFSSRVQNILSLADQVKTTEDYLSQTPDRTESELADKHNMSIDQITNILQNQEDIPKMQLDLEESTIKVHTISKDRLYKINLLHKVMLEYLERALYYRISIDDAMVLRKTEMVKDCIGIDNFQINTEWLIDFKNTYDVDDFSLRSLRRIIDFTGGSKRHQLDAADMVRYVTQEEIRKMQEEGANRNTKRQGTKRKYLAKQAKNSVQRRSTQKKTPLQKFKLKLQKYLPQTRNTFKHRTVRETVSDRVIIAKKIRLNNPHLNGLQKSNAKKTIVNEEFINESENSKDVTSLNNELLAACINFPTNETDEIIRIENSPMQLPGVNIVPYNQETLSNELLDKEQQSNTIIVNGMSSSDFNENNNHIQNVFEIFECDESTDLPIVKLTPAMSSTSLSSDEEFITIYPKPSNSEAAIIPNPQEGQCLQSTLVQIENYNQLTEETENVSDDDSDEPKSLSPNTEEISSLEEAMEHLRLLENYAILKNNSRAIDLVITLRDAFEESL